MAYVIQKKEDGIERNQVVLDYQGVKREVAFGLNHPGTIKSVLELACHSVVREVVPKYHGGNMSIVNQKDYTYEDFDGSIELYALFVESDSSQELFECLGNEKDLRSALTSHLSAGNSILAVFAISRTLKKYKELKVEIDGFEMLLK